VRIDFLVRESGEFYVNEVNTIPGSLSFYLWEKTDLPFPQLLDELIDIAFDRQRRQANVLSVFESNLLSQAKLKGKG
jgi:D-alanine-D-alanine ligase